MNKLFVSGCLPGRAYTGKAANRKRLILNGFQIRNLRKKYNKTPNFTSGQISLPRGVTVVPGNNYKFLIT
jgi:hypothetical protein